MPKPLKQMDITEFMEEGYLSEINRRFLHPLGLALFVSNTDEEPDVWHLGGVYDERDDPEGWRMGEQILPEVRRKMKNIQRIEKARKPARRRILGYWVQPVPAMEAWGPDETPDNVH